MWTRRKLSTWNATLMQGDFIIKPQRYPTANGDTPLSYGIFLETDEVIEGLSHWQDCKDVFIAYSWSCEGAVRAIRELREGEIAK